MGDKLYRAREPFAAVIDGVQVSVGKGELAREGASILKTHSEYFEEGADVRFDVEQATKEPGEKRGPGRPRKTPAKD